MKEFTKLFNQMAYRHDFMRAFDDFLTMAICAFSMGRMEPLYLDTIKGYSKDELNLFGNLLGSLIVEYENRSTNCGAWYDGLGDFFMDNNSKFGQDARGQFFTPDHICDMMAKITNGDDGLSERKICDPACGSGRMLIAFDRISPKYRYENFYVGGDVDLRCVKMCVLNMYLYGLKGAVVHMNSLSMEIWGGYRIFMPETGLGIRPLDKNQCLQYFLQSNEDEPEAIKIFEPLKITVQELKPEKAYQMTLF
jgi:hypothetical protein